MKKVMKGISDFLTGLGFCIILCGFADILCSYILMNGSPIDALIAPFIAPNYWLTRLTPFVFWGIGGVLLVVGENLSKEK